MDMIGEGSFGRVFRGKDKQTGEIVALKLIPKVGHCDKDIQSLRSECKIQKELNHPNIVRMIDAFETDNEVISVAEFVPGELFRLFDQYKAGKLRCIKNLSFYFLSFPQKLLVRGDCRSTEFRRSPGTLCQLCTTSTATEFSTGTSSLRTSSSTPVARPSSVTLDSQEI